MKFKHYEEWLTRNRTTFSTPQVALEQYATDPHLAACLGWTALERGDLQDRVVLDLGCGSGMLSLAASAFAACVLAVDVDAHVFHDFSGKEDVDCVLADVTKGLQFLRHHTIDAAITNPPFGTKNNAGIDCCFVEAALAVSPVCYSLHKSACRQALLKKLRSRGYAADAIAEMSFDLPKQFKFHKEDQVSVAVDLILSTHHG